MRPTTRCSLIAVLAAAGCYSPKTATLDRDTDGTGGTDASEPTRGTPPGTDPTTADPTTSSTVTTGDRTTTTDPTTTDTTEANTSTAGETELGPRLIDSMPVDDDRAAPLRGSFFLYFDRVVSHYDAVGKITVSQGGNAAVPVTPLPCPPDNDPTCIWARFPASFLVDELLPSDTDQEIIVAADFPDPDGRTNTIDQVVAFTTFEFDNNLLDDAAAYNANGSGALAFDPVAETLYISGMVDGTCVVRQIPAAKGVLGPATTVATLSAGPGPQCYGLDLYAGQLMVAMTYGGFVHVFDELGAATFDDTGFQIGRLTTLDAPHNDLDEVWGSAFIDGRYLFSFGNFLTIDSGFGLVDYVLPDEWSLFQSGEGLWSPGKASSQGVGLAVGQVGGEDYAFAHGGDSLYRFRLSDGALTGSNAIGQVAAPDLHVDEFGRVYLGTNSGLTVFDGDDLSVIATRSGMNTGRIAVSASSDSASIYFMPFRGQAVIGRLVIDF